MLGPSQTDDIDILSKELARVLSIREGERRCLTNGQLGELSRILTILDDVLQKSYIPVRAREPGLESAAVLAIVKERDFVLFSSKEHKREREAIEKFLLLMNQYCASSFSDEPSYIQRNLIMNWNGGLCKRLVTLYMAVVDRLGPCHSWWRGSATVVCSGVASLTAVAGSAAVACTLTAATGGVAIPILVTIVGSTAAGATVGATSSYVGQYADEKSWCDSHPIRKFRGEGYVIGTLIAEMDENPKTGFVTSLREVAIEMVERPIIDKIPEISPGERQAVAAWDGAVTGAATGAVVGGLAMASAGIASVVIAEGHCLAPAAICQTAAGVATELQVVGGGGATAAMTTTVFAAATTPKPEDSKRVVAETGRRCAVM